MTLPQFMAEIEQESKERIKQLHHFAKHIWKDQQFTPQKLQNRCLDAWDNLSHDIDSKILPFIPASENRPITNLIFGSGGFSTGEFQAEQYERVKEYTPSPPAVLQGLVTNKSELKGCNATKISKKFNIPTITLDFTDWYAEFIDKNEQNPIAATRYWFPKDDPNRPALTEIGRRFKIRQDQFHANLGERIQAVVKQPTDTVAARGYNFQFCKNIFKHQGTLPRINDTHPADLSYINPKTKERLYPGWQSGAVQLMLNDKLKTLRGSLIEVDYMNDIKQIDSLDEGSLLALGKGVSPHPQVPMNAAEIQSAMKVIDDYFFCTLEPTGLILLWGITEKALPTVYQALDGTSVIVKQRVIVVGDKFHSGIHAWGADLKNNLKELDAFLFK